MPALRRSRIHLRQFALVLTALVAFAKTPPVFAGQQSIDEFRAAAYSGDFAQGIEKLSARIRSQAGDIEARFGLGALQFFKAFADFQNGLYAHTTNLEVGGDAPGRNLTGLFIFPGFTTGAMIVPPNPAAEPMTYTVLRRLLVEFAVSLRTAEQSLAGVGDHSVKIPLEPFAIAFDLDHNGQTTPDERIFWRLIGASGSARLPSGVADETVVFDTADASWLRGYANVFLALTNLLLAVDFEATYEAVAHNLYGADATALGRELLEQRKIGRPKTEIDADIATLDAKIEAAGDFTSLRRQISALRKKLNDRAKLPVPDQGREELEAQLRDLVSEQRRLSRELAELRRQRNRLLSERDGNRHGDIMDLIALIHALDWPVIEPARLQAVRTHLLTVARLNRNTWQLARAETDDDREWLPNASQKSPFGARAVTDDVIDSWLATLALGEAVLNGEKLLPHPRFKKGVNLRKIFEEASRISVVGFVTGHDLVPYLEEGEVVDARTWETVTNPLGPGLGLYALWFN